MVLILITQKAWIYNDVHIEQNRSIQCFRPVIISAPLSTDVRVQIILLYDTGYSVLSRS